VFTFAKREKNHGLYILDSLIMIAHASMASQIMQDKVNLWH